MQVTELGAKTDRVLSLRRATSAFSTTLTISLGRGMVADSCDEQGCLSVCLSVTSHTSETTATVSMQHKNSAEYGLVVSEICRRELDRCDDVEVTELAAKSRRVFSLHRATAAFNSTLIMTFPRGPVVQRLGSLASLWPRVTGLSDLSTYSKERESARSMYASVEYVYVIHLSRVV